MFSFTPLGCGLTPLSAAYGAEVLHKCVNKEPSDLLADNQSPHNSIQIVFYPYFQL